MKEIEPNKETNTDEPDLDELYARIALKLSDTGGPGFMSKKEKDLLKEAFEALLIMRRKRS